MHRNRFAVEQGDIDIERRARLALVNLKCEPTDDRVGGLRVAQNATQRQKSRTLAPFHFAPQQMPLPVKQETGIETRAHDQNIVGAQTLTYS